MPACAGNLRFVFRCLFFFDLSHPVRCPCIIHDIIGIDEIAAYSVIAFSDKLFVMIGSEGKQQTSATLDHLRFTGIPSVSQRIAIAISTEYSSGASVYVE